MAKEYRPSSVVVALRYRRWVLRLSQEDLARALLVSVATLSSWEQGRRTPTLDNAERWAKALGVSIGLAQPESIEQTSIRLRVRKTLTERAA